jgi:chromate reductase
VSPTGSVSRPVLLLICGSVRIGSVNAAALATAAALAPTGTDVITYDGLGTLPLFNPDDDTEPLPAPVVALRAAIAGATAVLISTPEYAGAMPGALKNLLEWTVGGVEITDKPTGWINPSTGPTRAAGTYASLRTVLEYTGAAVVDEACADVPVPRSVIDSTGHIGDPAVRARISAVVDALVHTSTTA